METYQLYSSPACPFCMRVRSFLDASGLDIPIRDTMFDPEARAELIAGGGRATVPCLRIERGAEVVWMYESLDIIEYLRQRMQASASG